MASNMRALVSCRLAAVGAGCLSLSACRTNGSSHWRRMSRGISNGTLPRPSFGKAKTISFPLQHTCRAYSTRPESSTSNQPQILLTTSEPAPGHTITTLTFSNPTKLNIVSTPVLQDLITKCQTISTDPHLRAVILRGAPTPAGKSPSFIGGADIREMEQMDSYDKAQSFITLVHNACDALRQVPVPVIAQIHGFCLGAGLEIAASCDLRVATRESTFGMPEVKIGLPSVVEAAYLPGLIGWGRTRRFLYLAENIDATMAERWGLIEDVVETEEELERLVGEWTGRIVGMGPKCIRRQKVLMQHWEHEGVESGIQAGVEALAETFRDGGVEPRELMGRFLNRGRGK